MAVRVDLEELRRAVQDEYAEVAENPDRGFHFHTGGTLACILEYQPEWLKRHSRGEYRLICRRGQAVRLRRPQAGRASGRRWLGRGLRQPHRRHNGWTRGPRHRRGYDA